MMPRLMELAWLIALRGARGSARPGPATASTQTIDGMLFVGIRPAAHRAA